MEYRIRDHKGSTVGQATVKPAGLYLQILCLCNLPADKRWHIRVETAKGKQDLGLCSLRQGGIGLYTCIPAKRLGEGALLFYAEEETAPAPDFVPLCNSEPCPCVSRLRKGKLAISKGMVGIVFTD